ncbi:unnamed protein product [Cuscuta europaea]|uniref:Uncharacterized protein n=1 Tax=Cuscuta europaea TaxID=41803 RepID=A0A9P0Z110_CUSEU|nr:unnamed protein product [Cuscuta europaea]
MVANSKRKSSFLLFFIFFSSCIIFSCSADDGNKEKASPQEILGETYTLFTKVSLRYWDHVKSLINQAQLKFTPPDLDFRRKGDVKMGGKEHEGGAKERVKEAAEKSFGKSKEAVEESAKTAAHVVGEAVHETKEKVIKGNMHVGGKYADGDSHEEL